VSADSVKECVEVVRSVGLLPVGVAGMPTHLRLRLLLLRSLLPVGLHSSLGDLFLQAYQRVSRNLLESLVWLS
jgi:hypothetical protein